MKISTKHKSGLFFLNALQKVSRGSKNTLVEIIACLIDMAMYYLPVNYKVEVIRAERQSKASKNHKVQQKTGLRKNKPDLCFVLTFAKNEKKSFSLKVVNGILMKIKSAMTIIN